MPTPPKSADELRALVESILCTLPEKEQRRFWVLMIDHPDNKPARRFRDHFLKMIEALCGLAGVAADVYVEETNDLLARLRKHRKPAKNAARDAEIMRLHAEGKTAGQIVIALRSRYGTLKDGTVRAVISRKRSKPAHGS